MSRRTTPRGRYTVACPVCGVEPGEHCRTLTTNRVTDTHAKRIMRQYGLPFGKGYTDAGRVGKREGRA